MLKDKLFVGSQYLTPQHLLSRFAGVVASTETPAIKNAIIKKFIAHFGVDMSLAERENAEDYKHFNDFFTRALKPGVRPFDESEKTLVSPVDGTISQLGDIKADRIFQAKGHDYSTLELLGGDEKLAKSFENGSFATIYLSPKDYHRIHMPMAGELSEMIFVPGKLFSVNPATAENVPRLFARNERVVAIFETDKGPIALVLVGAMIVASIETTWAGKVAPLQNKVSSTQYGTEKISFAKGDEMGRFLLGSTVVALFPEGMVEFDKSMQANSPLQMGQTMGQILS